MEDKYHIVKYHNRMSEISIADLSSLQLDVFMSIISKFSNSIYNPETKTFTSSFVSNYEECCHFSYAELRVLTKLSSRNYNNRIFAKLIDGMYDGLRNTKCMISDGSHKLQFTLFPTFDNNPKAKSLSVVVHPLFKYLFGDLNSEFSAFVLEEFLCLKGKHEKYLYLQIKRNRGLGKFKYRFDNYKINTGINTTCENRYVLYRVIKPAIKNLEKIIGTLTLTTIKTGKAHLLEEFQVSFEITNKDLQINCAEKPKVKKPLNLEDKKGAYSKKNNNHPFIQRTYSNFEFDMLEKKKLGIISSHNYTQIMGLYSKLKSEVIVATERTALKQCLCDLSIDLNKYDKLAEL